LQLRFREKCIDGATSTLQLQPPFTACAAAYDSFLVGVLAVVKPFTTAILFGASLAIAAWPMRHLAEHLVWGTECVQAYFAATPDQPAWISSLPLGGFLSGSP